MCGIFGIASTKPINLPLERMTDTLSHRGPDSGGFYRDDNAYLGHRRLRIIDLEGGHQPIFNEDQSQCIIFNGEIYNYLDLRDDLIKKGHRFTTQSDTEVILHAYEQWGEKCVDYLRGMFAFAIWDTQKKQLFLARDRLGIKPIFYAANGGSIYFASEMKAILADSSFPRDMDEAAFASYFTLSYIPAPYTIYSGIRKLLPGHSLTWQNGNTKIRKYWDIRFSPDRSTSEDEFIDEFMGILQDSVSMHLMSEVPLGAFLSGGIDSSTIVALMAMESDRSPRTFSIGFGGSTGGYLDERQYAQLVSDRYRTRHREFEVQPDPVHVLGQIVGAFDEPHADDSAVPTYHICRMAREDVSVALSGLGGDEAFAGYERYLGFSLRRIYDKIPFSIRKGVIPRIVGHIPERRDGHYTVNHLKRFVRSGFESHDLAYFGYLSILSRTIGGKLFADTERFLDNQEACRELVCGHFNSKNVDGGTDSLDRALYCDLKTYLPEDILAVTDRMSMPSSLEVRVPFLDHELLELCARIPPEMKMRRFEKKYLLKKGVKKLVPEPVIAHRKQGFVGPMTEWLKTDLKEHTRSALSPERMKRHGLFDAPTVKRVLGEHFSGVEIHDTLIWSLLVFQEWYDTYIEGIG